MIIVLRTTTKVVKRAKTTVATVAKNRSKMRKIVKSASQRAMSLRKPDSVMSSSHVVSVTVAVMTTSARRSRTLKPSHWKNPLSRKLNRKSASRSCRVVSSVSCHRKFASNLNRLKRQLPL
ncbi:hypothetical protein D3C80_1715200 [compost metagenome]